MVFLSKELSDNNSVDLVQGHPCVGERQRKVVLAGSDIAVLLHPGLLVLIEDLGV